MEHGATRNFQAEKLLEEEEKRLQKEREEEELNNPMKVLQEKPLPPCLALPSHTSDLVAIQIFLSYPKK